MSRHILAYDIGTTDVKTCLFEIDGTLKLVGSASSGYPLYVLPDGGAEQDPDDWWKGMCLTTAEVISKTGISPDEIEGISFCSQMQGLVLVDGEGVPVRRAMSYMDQRATEEIKKGIANGIQVAGANIFKLIPSLIITGAVSSSVKDPIWKYKWVEAHEPENFGRARWWLDVKDYLVSRCTGRFAMTEDSAFATLLYDTRKGKEGWSRKMCSMFGIKTELLPPIIKSTDLVGGLTAKASAELGLKEGTPVFGGGGDSSLIGVGAGATKLGDTHVYSGTSGWIVTVVDKQMVDVNAMIAAITGAQSGRYNYFAEMETAGKSMQWMKDVFASDIIGDNYENLDAILEKVPAGSNGIVFTPWLHGNRCPFEDPDSTGMFFGAKLESTKEDFVKAVLEGVFYHLRWMLECQGRKVKISDPVRFVGGSALSRAACQMFADISGRRVETVESPKNVGSVGAAAVAAAGLGIIASLDEVGEIIPAAEIFEPNPEKHAEYDPYYKTFREIYRRNKKLYKKVKSDKAEKNKELKRTLKFVLFSASAGIIEIATFALLNEIFHLEYWVSYLTALILSVLWNFTFNRRYTFKSAQNVPIAMAMVFAFYLVFTPLSTLLEKYLTGINWNEYLVTGLNMACNLVTEYFYDRFVVYRNTIDTNDLS